MSSRQVCLGFEQTRVRSTFTIGVFSPPTQLAWLALEPTAVWLIARPGTGLMRDG
jgi:hypothetical protein